MLSIKFSHHYPKLYGQKNATLLSVLKYNRSELDDVFVEYDTCYIIDFAIGVCSQETIGHYPLPAGVLLVLVFLGDNLIPFTTVRRWTPKKEEYYWNNIGSFFKIEIDTETV